MFPCKCSDGIEVKDISQCVGDHHSPCPLAKGSFELTHIDLVGGQSHVHEDGHESILNYGIYCSGKARGQGNDLVARFKPPVTEFWRRERTDGKKVGGGTGIDQGGTADANKASQLSLEFLS